MKFKLLGMFLIIVIVIVGLKYDDIQDYFIWIKLSNKFDQSQIIDISLLTEKLDEDKKNAIISKLKYSRYLKSDRENRVGTTPYEIINLTFINGDTLKIYFYGNKKFGVEPVTLNKESFFIIVFAKIELSHLRAV